MPVHASGPKHLLEINYTEIVAYNVSLRYLMVLLSRQGGITVTRNDGETHLAYLDPRAGLRFGGNTPGSA